MYNCKICGQAFLYHITCAHLKTHDITRQEYNDIQGRDHLFIIHKDTRTQGQRDADLHNTEERIRIKIKNDVKGKFFTR